MDFSETIAACDLKVRRCRQLIEFMKVCEYLRSRSFLDLGPRLFTYKNLCIKIKKCFSQKPLGHFYSNFVCKLLGKWKSKFIGMMQAT